MKFQDLFKIAPVTLLLLISFVTLFIFQVLTGVSIDNPSAQDLIKWGANALPFTMGDDPWRLVSSAFLHIGLMHLLFNAFALYFFGQVAEPMFGHVKFLLVFLLSAVGGNILNNYLAWQHVLNDNMIPSISAGASGGIMGIGAALLMATICKMSVAGKRLNLKSLAMIMGINLIYGFAVPGIDNAGHIGGALSGALLGLAIALPHSKQQKNTQAKKSASILVWITTMILIIFFSWIWLDIHQQIALHLN